MVSRVTQTFPRRICSALDEHSYQDSSLSESQNMIANGWLQVYDCGTIKMEYHKT